MKIKIDENIPRSILSDLQAQGHNTDTVEDEGLQGHADINVWAGAQRDGRFLITQDLDFSDLRLYAPGTHHGLLIVRLRESGRMAVHRYIQALIQEYDLTHWSRCLVIGTEHKVRVKTPGL